MSPKQGCFVSAHKGEESSETDSSIIQSILGDKEVIQEPPQNVETTVTGEISKVPKVIKDPSQIDPTSA